MELQSVIEFVNLAKRKTAKVIRLRAILATFEPVPIGPRGKVGTNVPKHVEPAHVFEIENVAMANRERTVSEIHSKKLTVTLKNVQCGASGMNGITATHHAARASKRDVDDVKTAKTVPGTGMKRRHVIPASVPFGPSGIVGPAVHKRVAVETDKNLEHVYMALTVKATV